MLRARRWQAFPNRGRPKTREVKATQSINQSQTRVHLWHVYVQFLFRGEALKAGLSQKTHRWSLRFTVRSVAVFSCIVWKRWDWEMPLLVFPKAVPAKIQRRRWKGGSARNTDICAFCKIGLTPDGAVVAKSWQSCTKKLLFFYEGGESLPPNSHLVPLSHAALRRGDTPPVGQQDALPRTGWTHKAPTSADSEGSPTRVYWLTGGMDNPSLCPCSPTPQNAQDKGGMSLIGRSYDVIFLKTLWSILQISNIQSTSNNKMYFWQ